MKAASTIAEICARYGVGKTSLYKEIRRGKLRVFKVGRRTLILNEAEMEWAGIAHAPAHPPQRAPGGHRRTSANVNKR